MGLNPSRKHGKSPTLKNLFSWLDRLNLGTVSFTNLFQSYTPTPESNEILYIAEISKDYDKVLALGGSVSSALHGVAVDHFKLPHPSGLNRQINDSRFVDEQIVACKNYLYGGRDVL